jgi:superfamily I DNA/RNA helicase
MALKINGAPGTGKTHRTREIFKEAIESHVPISSIMYTTYRREVIDAEKEKISGQFDINIKSLRRINTIHGICLSLLYQNGLISKSKDHNPLMEWSDYTQFNKDCGYTINPNKVQSEDAVITQNDPYLNFNNLLKSTRTPINEAYSIQFDSKVPFDSLITFVEDFDEWKAAHDKIGFEDMVDIVLKERLSPDCSVQIYDEAQDMTTQLHDVAKMWAKEADEVVLAGDPLQTLYTYSGANPAYFMDWEGETEVLPVSRRLPANVWSLATELIADRTSYKAPEITPRPFNGAIISVDYQRLSDWLKGAPKNPASKVFHLVRTNYQGFEAAKALAEAGILFTGLSNLAWNQAEINLYNGIKAIQTGRTLTTQEFCTVLDAYPEEYIVSSFGKQALKEKLENGEATTTIKNFNPALISSIRIAPMELTTLTGLAKLKIEGMLNRNLPYLDMKEAEKTQILTIHGAKGMEADTVFLHTAIPKTIKKALLTQKGIENESYVWFVGITRTRKNLIFVTYNGKNYPIPGVCA